MTRCERLPALPEPLMGCRIDTLWSCYHDVAGALDLYQSPGGALLLQADRTLLVSGLPNAGELAAWASFCGAARVEGLEGDLPALPRYRRDTYTLMEYGGPGAPLPDWMEQNPDPKMVFSLLCRADDDFARQSSYLDWLSDLTRRRNRGRAKLLAIEQAATACVSATGCGVGWISSVAVASSRRGEGLGGRLVAAVAAHLRAAGLRPVAAAQADALERFYQQLGFSAAGRLAVLTLLPKERLDD